MFLNYTDDYDFDDLTNEEDCFFDNENRVSEEDLLAMGLVSGLIPPLF